MTAPAIELAVQFSGGVMLRRSVVFLIGLSLAAAVQAATFVVSPDGTGDYPTIQSAIDAASSGDRIELTDGTFTGPGNRDVDLLGKGVVIASQSGAPATCIIDCQAGPGNPHRAFLFTLSGPYEARLVTITIINGYAEGDELLAASGGAILCAGGVFASIDGCVFRGNHAAQFGGAVAYDEQSEGFVSNCVFSENEAGEGGGLACLHASALGYLAHCVFCDNAAANGGGASFRESPTAITECTFENNNGAAGAGLYLDHSSSFITECVFRGNVSEDRGGGLCAMTSSPEIRACQFYDNSAELFGGGVFCQPNSTPFTLSEVTLSGNAAGDQAVGFGGGLAVWRGAASITSCTLEGNAAAMGSGIVTYSVSALDTVQLHNSILVYGRRGEAFYCLNDPVPLSITCCDIFGNEGGDWTNCIAGYYGADGNLSEDPLLCAPEDDDFTLYAESPCAPGINPTCGLIGAWPVGCGSSVDAEVPFVRGARLVVSPNPTLGNCQIMWSLPSSCDVSVAIIDFAGRVVREFRQMPASSGAMHWDGRDDEGRLLAAGIYCIRVTDGMTAHSARIILAR